MAESSLSVKILGVINANIVYENHSSNVQLSVLENLCTDVIIGQDILTNHESLELHFGGVKPSLSICGLTTVNISPSFLPYSLIYLPT